MISTKKMDKPQANNSRKIERLKQILISSELLQSWLSSEKKKERVNKLKINERWSFIFEISLVTVFKICTL